MVYGSIVSFIDRLSVKTVLTNHTGSYIGFAATLIFIAVCIAVLAPPIYLYHNGVYFQSEFISDQAPKNLYYTGNDLVMAISFRNKKTNQYANHTQIIQKLRSVGYLYGPQYIYNIDLKKCQNQVFLKAINPLQVKDCIMLPQKLQYDITPVQTYLPFLQLFFTMKCQDPFKCTDNSPYKQQVAGFIKNLSKDYYYQFIFSSKIIDDQGYPTFQFHKVYSSQFDSPDGYAQLVSVTSGQRKTFVDNSIMPWWNNNTYTNLFWTGDAIGADISEGYVVTLGFFADYWVNDEFRYAYRYYKKLDFLLGTIGGAIFLIFLMFWLPFSYINRTLQKINNAEELFVAKDQIITTDQNLKKIQIPFSYVVTNFLPGNKHKDIIEISQNQIDIVKMIKKLKVAHRNLRTKGVSLAFKSRDLDFHSEPREFNPDRPALDTLDMNLDVYQALKESDNTEKIFQNNPTVLAIKQSRNIDRVMEDQFYEKTRLHKRSNNWREQVCSCFSEIIRFFDIFGARPMFNAQPQTSSCWGFCLTVIIIILSILTCALTIYNTDHKKIISSYRYESPIQHNYEMITSNDFRFAFCFDSAAANTFLTGANKTAQLTFFKNSKKYGYKELSYQKMVAGQFLDYFKLELDDVIASMPSQFCFRPSDGQKIQMGGSYQTINQAYFGARLDPYCSGTPSECEARKNQTITKFLNFVNYRTYMLILNQNKYSPEKGTLIPGAAFQEVSESDYVLSANLSRTETFFVHSIQLLDDTSKSFVRGSPKVLQRTMAFNSYGDRNEQRKGDPTKGPSYTIQFRPNGQVQSIIIRTYKIDFIFGIIGGCFLFWYFIINIFAKVYNAYKVRAKLAQILHQEDGYDQSILVHSMYISKFPTQILCCSDLKKDIQRVSDVDDKMKRDLNYLNIIKNVDNCYRLSSSLFGNLVQKDLSLIYFRQKIDQSQLVKPKRIKELDRTQFEDDQFLDFDDEDQIINNNNNVSLNATANYLPETSNAANNIHDLQKIIGQGRSTQTQPLYDPYVPYKQESAFSRFLKWCDLFKNPPELTLDGQRDVKSLTGGIMFFILLLLIVLVCAHFIGIYLAGDDYTVSHRRFIDEDLNQIDTSNTLGQINKGLNFVTGQNFKFAVTFNKKDHYYPQDVSQFIGSSLGIRILKYTLKKLNGQFNETYQQFQLEPCKENYLNGFLSSYNDPTLYKNLTLGYCVPNRQKLSVKGTPQDSERQYFKINIYNKFRNSTGRAILNSFFKLYLVQYHMSVPRLDIFAEDFNYQMTSFSYYTDLYSYPIENNMTFSKLIFSDRYFSRSRQTYNDKTIRSSQRQDLNFLSDQNTRNLTFYYDGMIDHYMLDYPGGAQLFGIVGGVIAMFTFIIYSLVSSFNQYRMKYLIGQRLYTFDKKLSGLTKEKAKKVKLNKIEEMTKKINNFNQLEILGAWIMNPVGYIRDNYNFNRTLRRVTLLIQRVQNDINLYNFFQNLYAVRDALNKEVKLSGQKHSDIHLTSVYAKHIYHSERHQANVSTISKQSKKHKLSPYQQLKIGKAMEQKINPQTILGDKVLNKAFGIDDGSSVLGSRMKMMDESSIQMTNMINKTKENKNNNNQNLNQSETHMKMNSSQAHQNVSSFEIQQIQKE